MARKVDMFEQTTLDNKLTVRNRIVFSPYMENMANRDGTVSPQMLNYYTNVAREGAGLVILESAYVAMQGRAHANQLGISDERHVPGLTSLIQALHDEGARVGVRLTHAGARTSEALAGEQPIGPSIINFGKDYDISREFDEGDVEEMVLFFVHAAERAEEAGADLIEINGAQLHLLDQCMSTRYNTRYDAYGGSIAERMQLAADIIKAIKSRLSGKLPLSYMFSIHDKLEDGFSEEDMEGLVKALSGARVDAFHPVSIHVLNKFFDAEQTLVEWIARFSRKPIIAEGNIKSPQILKETLALNKAHLFALDRVLYSRPNWHQFLQKKLAPPVAS